MKLERIDLEIAKAKEKAAMWQEKVREYEAMRREEENTQIVSLVRSLNLTPEQLAELIKNNRTGAAAPIIDKEEISHEEN